MNCSLCVFRIIYPTLDAYHEINNKVICSSCISEIYYQRSSFVPVDPHAIQTEIRREPPLEIGSFERCEAHGHKLRLRCESCEVAVCVECVPSHSQHAFSDATAKAREALDNLYLLEFVTKYFDEASPEPTPKLKKVIEEIVLLFYSLEGLGPNTILEKATPKAEQSLAFLRSQLYKLKGKSLQQIFEELTTEKPPYQRQGTPFIHWCQWDSRRVSYFDLERRSSHEFELRSDKPLPHFCRTIQIAPTKLLACGGREKPSSNGLAQASLIDVAEHTLQPISPMLLGRANHALVYFNSYVYVIGGCDSLNKYTNKCERISAATLSWERITSTNEIRDSTTGVGIHQDNSVYIFGARQANGLCTNSVEKYDVARKIWISLPITLTYNCMVAGSVQLPEDGMKVLVFGGQSATASPLTVINKLDLATLEVLELPAHDFDGGCIVNEPLVAHGQCYAYLFKGRFSRKLQRWQSEEARWVPVDA